MKMSLLYFIIICDLRLPLYSHFQHAVFYFVVADIMYSSLFALFHTWEGSGLGLYNRRLELFLRTQRLISLLLLLTCAVNSWMRDGTMLDNGK